MSMRWMKLEGTTFCTLFLFLLFSWNKIKLVFFCLFFDLSVQYKNTPKIKVLQMPWKWNMIFSGIFENIWHWEHNRRGKHLATRVEGAPYPPWARPLPRGPMVAPLHLFLHPHTSSSSQKKSPSSSSTSSSSFCCDFRSPCSKLPSQNCFGGLFLGMWLLQWSN